MAIFLGSKRVLFRCQKGGSYFDVSLYIQTKQLGLSQPQRLYLSCPIRCCPIFRQVTQLSDFARKVFLRNEIHCFTHRFSNKVVVSLKVILSLNLTVCKQVQASISLRKLGSCPKKSQTTTVLVRKSSEKRTTKVQPLVIQ